jgi:hypothetical protein
MLSVPNLHAAARGRSLPAPGHYCTHPRAANRQGPFDPASDQSYIFAEQ